MNPPARVELGASSAELRPQFAAIMILLVRFREVGRATMVTLRYVHYSRCVVRCGPLRGVSVRHADASAGAIGTRPAPGAAIRPAGRGLRRWLALAGFALVVAGGAAEAQDVAPHAIDIPPWFTETFLDFRDDIRDAARDERRVMVYFGQDGCPYCTQLMVTNFSQRNIVEKTRKHFVAIALNLWGDRETTWLDGQTRSEKALARFLDVQFTPTLLFFDERGAVVARLNGYYPPHRFEAVLDFVSGKHERKETLAAYLAREVRDPASARLADESFFCRLPTT